MVHPRILLGPQEISGYYSNLEAGLLKLGLTARLVTTHPHPFGYAQARTNPFFARVASAAVLRHRQASNYSKPFWALMYLFASFLVVLWAVLRFDVFIFAWGTSFLPINLDIPLLRLCGKKVYVVLGHGSEARPPYMTTPLHDDYPTDAAELKRLRTEVRKTAATVRRNEKFATKVIGMQMNAQYLRKNFIDFYRLGLPTTLAESSRIRQLDCERPNGQRFVVLHVPSDRAAKGSDAIQTVMKHVTAQFSDVEFRELSGLPHSVILAEMMNADLIVDQLWSDLPMAVVGTEAAALGKPTIVSSYGWPQWDEWQERHGRKFLPPVIRATPATLSTVIEQAILRRDETAQVGLRAREFIEEVWSPTSVASNYLRVIGDSHPDDWEVKPEDVNYLWGSGASRASVLRMVNALLKDGGPAALFWDRGASLYSRYL